MSDVQALRTTILQQSDPIGTKQRFGLFSHPISTAIGDDGPYKTKLHPRGENGKPVTELRNFYTSRTKSGQLDYFQPIKSLATSNVKDIFIEQGKRLLKQQNQRFSNGRKQASFYPANLTKTLASASYKYAQQNNPELNPKRNRDDDGKVKTQLRNFYTNPQSKVQTQVFKQPKYISDPFDRKHQMEVQLMKKNKALEAQAPFKPNSFLPKTLNPDKKIYGLDMEINKKPQKQTKFNIYQHQTAFRSSSPMKSGHGGFLSPFPKYIENPPKELKRIDSKPDEKGKFRSMSSVSTRPTPSITMMSVKRSMHSSLRR